MYGDYSNPRASNKEIKNGKFAHWTPVQNHSRILSRSRGSLRSGNFDALLCGHDDPIDAAKIGLSSYLFFVKFFLFLA